MESIPMLTTTMEALITETAIRVDAERGEGGTAIGLALMTGRYMALIEVAGMLFSTEQYEAIIAAAIGGRS